MVVVAELVEVWLEEELPDWLLVDSEVLLVEVPVLLDPDELLLPYVVLLSELLLV